MWRPPLCTHCKVFGHEVKSCRLSSVPVEDKVERAKEDGFNAKTNVPGNNAKTNVSGYEGENWQEARKFGKNGASTSRYNGQQNNVFYGNRGGFSNRGRCGFNGRGYKSEK